MCPNLNNDHTALLDIYRSVDSLPGVKKSFIGSGVRYDLAMAPSKNEKVNTVNRRYLEELIRNHVSGRLKVAPERHIRQCSRYNEKAVVRSFQEIQAHIR